MPTTDPALIAVSLRRFADEYDLQGATRWDENPVHTAWAMRVAADLLDAPTGPPPGTPLAIARMVERESRDVQSNRLADLAAAVAALAEGHDDAYSSHVALCERFDTLERVVRDHKLLADNAAECFERLCERVCSLEDRNEHVARILAADGPESGV